MTPGRVMTHRLKTMALEAPKKLPSPASRDPDLLGSGTLIGLSQLQLALRCSQLSEPLCPFSQLSPCCLHLKGKAEFGGTSWCVFIFVLWGKAAPPSFKCSQHARASISQPATVYYCKHMGHVDGSYN